MARLRNRYGAFQKVTVRRCRELLPGGATLTDAEVERRRDQLRTVVEVAVDAYLATRRSAGIRRLGGPRSSAPDRVSNGEHGFRAVLHVVPEDKQYEVKERAAIMELDGGVDRDEAERLAVLQIVPPHVQKQD